MSKQKRYQKPNNQQNDTFIKPLLLKNSAQEYYVETMKESTVTFCLGPAGTGKTYLATYVALEMLLKGEVDKIVLTRPLVATEEIGFLPGDFDQKIAPYLMPLKDAIEDHVGFTKSKQLFEDGKFEVLPLAYMRGRSLNRCVMLLDEGQNCTKEQMKMFLTRIGYNSKIIVTGDTAQSDLKGDQQNGMEWACEKLKGATGEISVVEFSSKNIVRNPLIEKILRQLDGPSINRSIDDTRRRSR